MAVNDSVVTRGPAVPVSRSEADSRPRATVMSGVPAAEDVHPPVAVWVTMEVVGHHHLGSLPLCFRHRSERFDQVQFG